jgi:hypothetical protein
MNQEAAFLRKLEHGRAFGENIDGDVTGLTLAIIADDLVHQHPPQAGALEIGAPEDGGFGSAIVD